MQIDTVNVMMDLRHHYQKKNKILIFAKNINRILRKSYIISKSSVWGFLTLGKDASLSFSSSR